MFFGVERQAHTGLNMCKIAQMVDVSNFGFLYVFLVSWDHIVSDCQHITGKVTR